jgi:FMN-dependent oxidoreductase (nitrilotriacetate monooxygenase family)
MTRDARPMSRPMSRPMTMALLLTPVGSHVATWRHPEVATDRINELAYYEEIAKAAEAACYDLLFIADTLYVNHRGRAVERRFPRHAHLEIDPMLLLAALAPATARIGLAATVSTTYSTPYATARTIASLDHLTGGRAAWNVVTSQSDMEARNYGVDLHARHAERYAMAAEYVDVVGRLLDSWEEDAVIADKASGVAVDATKLHRIAHQGAHYAVEGPLNIRRPPQGRPVVIQAGSSEAGQQLAARTADIVFTAQETKAGAQAFYKSLKDRLPAHGRAADAVKIVAGVMAVVGRTDEEARAKFQAMQDLVDPEVGMALLGIIIGDPDFHVDDVDAPLPPLADSNASQSRFEAIRRMGADEQLSVREIYTRLAPARGHLTLIGSAERVADTLAEWYLDEAADGFMLVPGMMPHSQADFDELVLPILRERGLVRRDYEGTTLRDHLGLAKPANVLAKG